MIFLMNLEEYLEDAVNSSIYTRHAAIINGQEMRYIKFLTTLYTPSDTTEHDFFWKLWDNHLEQYNLLQKTYDPVKSKVEALRNSTIDAAKIYFNKELDK